MDTTDPDSDPDLQHWNPGSSCLVDKDLDPDSIGDSMVKPCPVGKKITFFRSVFFSPRRIPKDQNELKALQNMIFIHFSFCSSHLSRPETKFLDVIGTKV
jgi:hypothetical protein